MTKTQLDRFGNLTEHNFTIAFDAQPTVHACVMCEQAVAPHPGYQIYLDDMWCCRACATPHAPHLVGLLDERGLSAGGRSDDRMTIHETTTFITFGVTLRSCAQTRKVCAFCDRETDKQAAQVFLIHGDGEAFGTETGYVICPDRCLPALHRAFPELPSPEEWFRACEVGFAWNDEASERGGGAA